MSTTWSLYFRCPSYTLCALLVSFMPAKTHLPFQPPLFNYTCHFNAQGLFCESWCNPLPYNFRINPALSYSFADYIILCLMATRSTLILVNSALKIKAEVPYKVWLLTTRLEFVTIIHFNSHDKFMFRHFGKFTRIIVNFQK